MSDIILIFVSGFDFFFLRFFIFGLFLVVLRDVLLVIGIFVGFFILVVIVNGGLKSICHRTEDTTDHKTGNASDKNSGNASDEGIGLVIVIIVIDNDFGLIAFGRFFFA